MQTARIDQSFELSDSEGEERHRGALYIFKVHFGKQAASILSLMPSNIYERFVSEEQYLRRIVLITHGLGRFLFQIC